MAIIDCQVSLEGNFIPGINQNTTQLASLLERRGIDHALITSSRAALVDPLTGNRILKSMIEQMPSFYGCLATHTNRVDASLQAIKELLGGRRFLSVMLASNDPLQPLQPLVADELLNACRRYQKPICLLTPNAKCVEAGLFLAKTYSMHRFIFLGMGGSEWRAAIAAAHQSANIYLETSGSLDRAKLPAAIETVGSHRLLFGSGLPVLDPAAALGLLEDGDVRPNDRRRILYDNAEKLFSLSDIAA